MSKTEEMYGLIDSGATHNVRELKENEDYRGLFPIEVEVAFNSEVKIALFMNKKKERLSDPKVPKRLSA